MAKDKMICCIKDAIMGECAFCNIKKNEECIGCEEVAQSIIGKVWLKVGVEDIEKLFYDLYVQVVVNGEYKKLPITRSGAETISKIIVDYLEGVSDETIK